MPVKLKGKDHLPGCPSPCHRGRVNFTVREQRSASALPNATCTFYISHFTFCLLHAGRGKERRSASTSPDSRWTGGGHHSRSRSRSPSRSQRRSMSPRPVRGSESLKRREESPRSTRGEHRGGLGVVRCGGACCAAAQTRCKSLGEGCGGCEGRGGRRGLGS